MLGLGRGTGSKYVEGPRFRWWGKIYIEGPGQSYRVLYTFSDVFVSQFALSYILQFAHAIYVIYVIVK